MIKALMISQFLQLTRILMGNDFGPFWTGLMKCMKYPMCLVQQFVRLVFNIQNRTSEANIKARKCF